MDDVDIDFFKTFDRDEENCVTVKALISYLVIKYTTSRKTIRRIVRYYDSENRGKLNEKEYLDLMRHMRADVFNHKDLNNFDAYDLNRDEFIDEFEFFCVLNNMGFPTLYSKACEMIRKTAKNNDNQINREEFKNLFKK